MVTGIFIFCALILFLIVMYRQNDGDSTAKFIASKTASVYNKYAPYSFKEVRDKVKDLGQEYTPRQYAIQIIAFGLGAGVIGYLYFFNLIVSIVYAIVAIMFVPYLTYLRCKRVYSEFIFEQIQTYTTNTIMEFATTQSFVKALEGVYESGVLEDPVKSDVKMMIDLAYEYGTINQSIDYMNNKYDYYIVKNMHQLFLQITVEGSKDAGASLENMSQDIDRLVEGVYRDRLDRAAFYKKFVQFGIVLYLMVMLVQFLLGYDSYIVLLDNIIIVLLLHGIIILNTFFLLRGTKYYNEDVGAE